MICISGRLCLPIPVWINLCDREPEREQGITDLIERHVAILISTAFFDVLSYLIKWYLEKEEADKINRKIEEYRRKKNNE